MHAFPVSQGLGELVMVLRAPHELSFAELLSSLAPRVSAAELAGVLLALAACYAIGVGVGRRRARRRYLVRAVRGPLQTARACPAVTVEAADPR
jgi:hypothetical protein